MPYHAPFCQKCKVEHAEEHTLEEDPDTRNLVCPNCYRVDEVLSRARNTVSDSQAHGAVLDDVAFLPTFQALWAKSDGSEDRQFKVSSSPLL